MRPEPPLRQHIGIWPVALLRIGEPLGQPVEHIPHAEGPLAVTGLVGKRPAIPMVVGDAPHLRIFGHFAAVLKLRRSRRKAQHHRPARLANRRGNLANLGGPVRVVADAVHLDVIQPPARIELQHRIVISLSGFVVLDPPVAVVPGTGIRGVRRVRRMKLRPRDGQILLDRLARNPAHNMNAELQPLLMHPVSQRLEARPVRRRWEAAGNRNLDSIRVQQIFLLSQIGSQGILHVPTLVDHRILPPKVLNPCQDGGVGLEIGLADGPSIGVPAIPAHRRRGCDALRGAVGCGEDEKKGGEKQAAACHG